MKKKKKKKREMVSNREQGRITKAIYTISGWYSRLNNCGNRSSILTQRDVDNGTDAMCYDGRERAREWKKGKGRDFEYINAIIHKNIKN